MTWCAPYVGRSSTGISVTVRAAYRHVNERHAIVAKSRESCADGRIACALLVVSLLDMQTLTPYTTSGFRSARAALRASGLESVKVPSHVRPRRRPHRDVFYDERARSSHDPSNAPAGGTYQAGLFGEEMVADGFARGGWKVLGHRVRTKVGEIDLIARRGSAIVFAEVKTAGPHRLEVEAAVDAKSRNRIRRAAVTWMAANPQLQRGVQHYRFDVFLVRRDAAGCITRIDQIRDAF